MSDPEDFIEGSRFHTVVCTETEKTGSVIYAWEGSGKGVCWPDGYLMDAVSAPHRTVAHTPLHTRPGQHYTG